MKTADEIRKAYEEKKAERDKAKMEVVKGVANYITETLYEEAKKGIFSPDSDIYLTITSIEKLAVNGPYRFSGYVICNKELHSILRENGVEFEQTQGGQIRVFLSK